MNTRNLVHDDQSIRCTGCGNRFEVSRHVLANPMMLLELKEAIAADHTCRAQQFSIVRVWQAPTSEIGLEAYWNDAMRRLMPAQP